MLHSSAIFKQITNYVLSPFSDVYSKRSSTGKSIVVLDGIRGLAVLIVLASHTNSFGMHGQGSLGVLLFFFSVDTFSLYLLLKILEQYTGYRQFVATVLIVSCA